MSRRQRAPSAERLPAHGSVAEAAFAETRSNCAMATFFRRIRIHFAGGRQQAILAAAPRLLVVSTLGSALAACTADRVVTGSTNIPDYRQRHPIVLTEGAHTLDVFVTGPSGLDARQREDLRAFAVEYRKSGQGAILARLPVGSRNDAAAHYVMARISEALAEAGLPSAYVAVSSYPVVDPLLAAPIRLSFSRLTARVTSPCGTWPHDLGASDYRQQISNETYWNLGCAMQSNVAAQVADPVDLVRGRAEGPPDSTRRGKVIQAIRDGKDPSTQYRQEGSKINQAVGN